jgi:hypothetical protein
MLRQTVATKWLNLRPRDCISFGRLRAREKTPRFEGFIPGIFAVIGRFGRGLKMKGSEMKSYGIVAGMIAVAVLGIGIAAGASGAQTSAGVQNSAQASAGAQAGTSAQAQTSAPGAAASAGASQQSSQGASAGKNSAGGTQQTNQSASTSTTAGPKSVNATGASSNSTAAHAGANSLNIANGTSVPATLVTPVDAKHSKPGDPIVAKTTQDVKQDGHVVLKKGSRLTGHVTQAQPRAGANSQSTVAMVFDGAVTKRGEHVPMNMSVQALAASANQTSAALADDDAMIDSAGQAGGFAGGAAPTGGGIARSAVGGGGSALGGAGGTIGGVGNSVGGASRTAGGVGGSAGQTVSGVSGTAGAATRTASSTTGNVGGLNAAGQLTSGSSGVFNLQGLNLTSAASSGTQGSASIVSSTSRNVHLDSGTQMLLQVANQ